MMKYIALTAAAMLPFAASAQTIDQNAPAAKLCVQIMAQNMAVPKTEVAIYDMLQSEAGTVVFMTVGSKTGAWKCFVTPDGEFDGLDDAE